MKVGIISKEEHCKPHAAVLRDMGIKVTLLGGRPTSIPPSVDVVVCRTCSSSHAAFDVAKTAERDGRPVVYEESVTGIAREVGKLRPRLSRKDTTFAPVYGILHRAYGRKRQGGVVTWEIRTGPKFAKAVGSASSREEAEKRIKELDEALLRGLEEPVSETPVPEAEVKTETKADPRADLEFALLLLVEEMGKLGLSEASKPDLGLWVRIEPIHLLNGEGTACQGEGERASKILSDVTCEDCKVSQWFVTVQAILDGGFGR